MKETIPETATGAETRPPGNPIRLGDRLGLIELIDEGMRAGSAESPIVADLFDDLWELVNRTVSGSKIDPLKFEESPNGFRVFEINADNGENLGRLNMLYLKKPIPCYYLVYVEVSAPYRKRGLGTRVLEHFRDFLIERSAVGLLDNIIPKEDPTYDIYLKQAWEPVEAIIGDSLLDPKDSYMIYIPQALQKRCLREQVLKLVFHLKRRRPAIDMRDNEEMVRRTISEFKDLYGALASYFRSEIQKGSVTPLMSFMFTRYVTKLIGFRRRISTLLGYTGGESLEQITLAPEVSSLKVQSYAPAELASMTTLVDGDTALWDRLPEALKVAPARFIETLPDYRRPSLVSWLQARGRLEPSVLTLGDLMDLGFDPTRLKEIRIEGVMHIFERIQARQLPDLEKKRALLARIDQKMLHSRVLGASLKTNPPLLTIRDRGNAYVLRKKLPGVHWEEAVEQLQGSERLKGMNASMKVDRLILSTVRKAAGLISETLDERAQSPLGLLACFVPWDLEENRPRVMIDFSQTYLECVWMA